MEIWIDIEGYEGKYRISNFGRVLSLSRKICWKEGTICRSLEEKFMTLQIFTGSHNTTYMAVWLRGKGPKRKYFIHKLVASHFLLNPENHPVVNHKDLNKFNNHVSNLEWISFAGNTQHYYDERKRIKKENAHF